MFGFNKNDEEEVPDWRDELKEAFKEAKNAQDIFEITCETLDKIDITDYVNHINEHIYRTAMAGGYATQTNSALFPLTIQEAEKIALYYENHGYGAKTIATNTPGVASVFITWKYINYFNTRERLKS